MQKPEPGDKVRIIKEGKAIEGILMPNQETDAVVIKLGNGYNMGIAQSKVKGIELVKKIESKESKLEVVKPRKGLPTISILHTGGTIASKVDYRTGGVVARFEPEEILSIIPEIREIANIRSRLISRMFSEDMRFVHYQIMVRAIKEEIASGADGIILTHGTDTMGYTAAALSFMLQELPIPVILVGAQRSTDRGSCDAAVNMICASEFIAKSGFAEVGICMHESPDDEWCVLLPGTKTRKMHTSRRDAFKPINAKPIARINYKTREIQFISPYKKKSGSKLVVKDKMEEKVGIIKAHPNMFPEEFLFYKSYKGLIIEGTGLGQAPVGVPNEECRLHKRILAAIEELTKSGCIVVMCSQAMFGRVQMHVYSNAIDLVKAGVIPGEDMLTETAFIKLAWLLGNFKREEARQLVQKNIVGEIRERIVYNEKFSDLV